MRLPPPRSTLFPYTTLFRSSRELDRLDVGSERATEHAFEEAFEGDRKSTRLNSSHSQISYAVFCLKKKSAIGFPFQAVGEISEEPLLFIPVIVLFRRV